MSPRLAGFSRRMLGAYSIMGVLLVGALSHAGPANAASSSLVFSSKSDRSSARTLSGTTLDAASTVYIFVTDSRGVSRVSFYLDDPNRTKAPRLVEPAAPWDFNGTAADGSAVGYSLSGLAAGSHTVTAAIDRTKGSPAIISASFTVSSPTPATTTPTPTPTPTPTSTPTSSTSGSTSTSTTSVDPSGEPAPRGDLTGWRQVFVDDFATDVPLGSFPAAVSAKWSAYPQGWQDTSKNGWYDPQRTISIGGGMMDMWLHTENVGGVMKHLVAAPVPNIAGMSYSQYGQTFTAQTYGRYAMRFKADSLPGYKTAWLLWPTSDVWPRDGEIDFPEGDLNGNICGFMHWMNGTSGADQYGACSSSSYAGWHTAVLEWTPSACRFYLDGNLLMAPTTNIPSTPMRWVLQTETALGGVVPADSTSGHVKVDWVAAWAPA